MPENRTSLGRRGEELAAAELARRGYDIVDRNWYCRFGEVDVVGRRSEAWTFFEVRTRRGRAFGTPEESVTSYKVERMIKVAQMYLSMHDINVHQVDWQIGVVAVEMDDGGHLLRVDIYENPW